ncbi:MAG: hypothetical protein JWR42_2667, partial [Marmoricola sp.]|nr:hypothetical protein [Marmoricola sp.]
RHGGALTGLGPSAPEKPVAQTDSETGT